MIEIDKLAVVHKDAIIGENCKIGPFCTVAENTKIGANTTLRSHVVVEPHTSLGEDCDVFPFVTLGMQSQDQKYIPETVTYTVIGSRSVIREFASVHSGTEEHSTTSLGDDSSLLAHSHIGHNCTVGNNVIISHGAVLAGHVIVGDHANIGGLSAIHQFCHVGKAAMIAGMARTIHGDHERYLQTYFSSFKGFYFSGDAAPDIAADIARHHFAETVNAGGRRNRI